MNSWLVEVSKDNPAKALDIIIKLSDFVLPKLKQIDSANDQKDSLSVNIPIISWVCEGLEPEVINGGVSNKAN